MQKLYKCSYSEVIKLNHILLFLKKAKDILENYVKVEVCTEFLGLAAAGGAGPSLSIVI